MLGRIILPTILAIIIAVIVSFAVQGFISFVSLISTYLRGEKHILLGLPREVLILSGPVIAGILVSLIYKIALLYQGSTCLFPQIAKLVLYPKQ